MSHLMPIAGVLCARPDGHDGRHRSIGHDHCKCASHVGDEHWHGTVTGYIYHSCRCDACRAIAVKKSTEYLATPIGLANRRMTAWRNAGIIGMTVERFDKMIADQGNCCLLCGKEFTGDRAPAVDHDHAITDRDNVRGILCHSCNTHVGWIENRPCKVADYLGWPLAECA